MNPADLTQLARSLTGPFAFCGIAVARGGMASYHVSTAAGAAAGVAGADEDTLFRVASVSKVITGGMVNRNLREADVSLWLNNRRDGPLFRHPNWPDVPITGAMLASHQAGLTDAAGYLVPTDQSLTGWIADQGDAIWTDAKPGHHFQYSNLGYVILATALDGPKRFDHDAARYLTDLGVTGGFNWSGVDAADRLRGMATYRKEGDRFAPQIDAEIAPQGVIGPEGRAVSLGVYHPGRNAGVFSPQGGLRTNLRGMLRIAQTVVADTRHPILWSPEMGTMRDEDGLFDQYALGVQILRQPPFYPRPLVGHFGNAYGFKGGVWYDRAADIAFAYALNGAAMGDEADALSPEEAAIFNAIAALED